MQKSKHGIFSKVLSTALSAACMLSTVAFIGTAASPTVDAASTSNVGDASTFSWDNASVYFLLTDRFNNGDPSNDHSYGRGLDGNGNAISTNTPETSAYFMGGDFKGITDKINEGYFDELGVNAIWMSAPYEQIHGYIVGGNGSPSFVHYSYHGYYVLDYTESDKNFGTKQEFKTLVDTAHEHGIRIVLDIVMNHAGYNSLKDMSEYGFGTLKNGWESYYNAHQNVNNSDYHSYIDYDGSAADWAKWWGPDWVRCGLPGYTNGNGDIEGSLEGLPDFKTGSTQQVGIPEVLKTKWTQEGTYNDKVSKYGSSNTVTGYISDWLAEWVREFGVDGFRCDTAKHVELSAWKTLKTKCVTALKEWKQNNPTKKLDDLDFWMTGECFGHQMAKSAYFTEGGFDSMINFEFAPAAGSSNIPQAGTVDSVYSRYANSINSDDNFNVLSYLASHDTTLAQGDRKYAGSFLLMLPGGIQIYYGDETNRPMLSVPSDSTNGAGHKYRSFMNWNSVDQDVLDHWQKVGQFRNNHIAVGAGQHAVISPYNSSTGYTFSRTYDKNGIQDKVVVTLFAAANTQVTVDVSSVWSDGMEITNFYDGTTCVVSGGKVTFNSGANGTILMQEPQGAKGKVTVKHINKDTNEVIKTNTMVGLIGESYTTSADEELLNYYRVSSVTGAQTGTYSDTEVTVTYYYTFDNTNNGIIKVQYVDAATGAEIAESTTSYGRIGTTYSVTPVTVRNYEVDESLTSNATGTVRAGTTTVVFKYNYVEPTNVAIHYYNSNSWSSVSMYVYDESGTTVEEYAGRWPGTAMVAEGDGWFYGEVDAETATFIANNGAGTAQDPSGQETPGYDVSGEVWIKNGQVYPTGKVNVRYVDTNGRVLATETLKGMADGSTSYTTTAKTFNNYTLTTTPSNATGKFTESTITVTYIYSGGSVIDDLVNNSTISATSINLGSSITARGAATGGTAPYQYAFYYKRTSSSSWTEKQGYSTTSSVSIKPAAATTYDVCIKVKDANGTEVKKYFTLTVKANTTALKNNSTISATSITLGSSITAKGAATGGTSPYKYAYYYKKTSDTKWTEKQGYSTTSSVSIKPTAATTYDVCIKVKDAKGTEVKKYFTVTVKGSTLKNNSTLSSTSIKLGTTLTAKGAATGGKSPYTYAYYYKKTSTSSWTTIEGYGTKTSVQFRPLVSGTYDVCIKVKDADKTEVKKYFTVKVTEALINNSTISATSITLGQSITAKGAATGGTKAYQYAYYYKKTSDTKWTEKQGFSTTTSVSIKPAKATTYDVCIKVKDANGTIEKKYFTLTVKAAATALKNNSTISATSITLGSTITAKGAATGGTSPYQYAYYYKKTSDTKWTEKKGFSTTTSVSIKPATATTYDVCIKVKDTKGTIEKKYFTLKVSKATSTALTNNSTISATTIALGSSITAKGTAAGGSGSYQYAYYYKKTSDTKWTEKKGFSTTTSVSIKPAHSTTYQVCIKVKDAKGTIVKKYFDVAVNKSASMTNVSKVSATSVSKGTKITITGAASNGSTPYFYQYSYKLTSDSSYKTIKDFSTSTSASFTPSTAGTYTVRVVVQDMNATIKTKLFTIKVS